MRYLYRFIMGLSIISAIGGAAMAGQRESAKAESVIAATQSATEIPGAIILRGKCRGPGDFVFTVNMTLEANGLGELVGKGRYELDFSLDGPGYEWVGNKKVPVDKFIFYGALDFDVKGTFVNKTVKVAGPISMVRISKVSGDKGTITLPEQMRSFKGTLTPDPETGLDTYKGVVDFHIAPKDSGWKMATIITGKLPQVHPVQVAIQHPIQPAIPRIRNQVTFVLPKSATFPEGKKYTVLAYTKKPPADQWARLWVDGDETKKFKLQFDNVKPGEMMTFNYSWTDAPPKSLYKERVYVKVENPALEGYVDFDVGMAFKIVKVRQRDLVPRVTQKEYDLRVSVIDIFHPSIDLAAVTERLGVAPVLTLKQSDYTPGVTLLDALTEHSPTKILEFWSQGKYSLKPGALPPTIITGNELPFKLKPDGKDFILQNPGGEVPFPSLQFRSLGAHWFDVSIDKLRYSGTSYDSTQLKKRKFMWCLYDYGGAEKDVYEILGPCLETIMGVEDALENPIEYGQQLSECMKKLKESRDKNKKK